MLMSSMAEESEDSVREGTAEHENGGEIALEDDAPQIDEDEENKPEGVDGATENASTLSSRASEDPDTGPQEEGSLADDTESAQHGLRALLKERAEDSPSIPDDTPSVQV